MRLSEYEVFINVGSTASRFDAQRYASKTVKLCNNTTWTNRTWLSSFQTGTRADVFADRQTDRRTDGRNNHTLGVVHHARISSRSATWRTSREDDESVRLWLCAYLQQRGQIGTVKLRQSGRTGQTNMTRAPAPYQNKQHATGANVMLRTESGAGRRARVSWTGFRQIRSTCLLLTEMTDIRCDGHSFCLQLSAFYNSELTQNRIQTVSGTSISSVLPAAVQCSLSTLFNTCLLLLL